jgi:hypothetical protein
MKPCEEKQTKDLIILHKNPRCAPNNRYVYLLHGHAKHSLKIPLGYQFRRTRKPFSDLYTYL